MHFFSFIALASVSALVLASPIALRDNDFGLERICKHLDTADHGCIRYVQGFDVTGVVTEVDLTFPEIQDKCDCIQACLDRPTTCASWVYKFSSPASIHTGQRTCTLYSQFNLPADVTIEIATNSSKNVNINAAKLIADGNNPQAGSLVPQAFKDADQATPDDKAFSGAIWQLSTGQAVC